VCLYAWMGVDRLDGKDIVIVLPGVEGTEQFAERLDLHYSFYI
jgi:hypothetical protein